MPRFRRTILPVEISDWVCSILQMMPKSTQIHLEHTTSGLQIGKSGKNSCSSSELVENGIWKLFPPLEHRQSLEHSLPLSERRSTREAKARRWLQAQSNVPLQMFHRNSDQIDSLILGLTWTKKFVLDYNKFTEALNSWTPRKGIKRPYL